MKSDNRKFIINQAKLELITALGISGLDLTGPPEDSFDESELFFLFPTSHSFEKVLYYVRQRRHRFRSGVAFFVFE
ncbi:MAG: hypothetical protein II821_00590 [Treponema sp.]|nr:hypothetical protein [Treponema sp.]